MPPTNFKKIIHQAEVYKQALESKFSNLITVRLSGKVHIKPSK